MVRKKNLRGLILDSKKGQNGGGVLGAFLMMVLVVVIIYGIAQVNIFGGEIVDEIALEINVGNNYTAESIAPITSMQNNYNPLMDGIVGLALIGLWILGMAMAYNASTHPYLGVLALLLVVILGLVGMILSNTWEDVAHDTDLANQTSNQPLTDFILTNYLLFVIIIGGTISLAFFLGASNS